MMERIGASTRVKGMTVVAVGLLLATSLMTLVPGARADEAVAPAPTVTTAQVRDSVLKGLAWLATQQAPDGGWSTTDGIAGLALAAYEAAGYDYTNQTVQKGLGYIRSFYNDTNGHAFDSFYFYEQAISLMALVGAGDPQDAGKVPKMVDYLLSLQYTQGMVNGSNEVWLGGMPGSGGVPDLSTMQFDSLGLLACLLQRPDIVLPAGFWDGIVTYTMKCQNWPAVNPLDYAHNTSHKSYNDGGFVYNYNMGRTAAGSAAMESYGSITAAGLFLYLAAGHGFENLETIAARAWVDREFTTEFNPRIGAMGTFYYLWTLARALAICPQDRVVDDSKKVHEWRSEIAEHYISTQRADGGWDGNPASGWRENEPVLASIDAMMTLEAAYLIAPDPSFELQVSGASSARFVGPDGDVLANDTSRGLTVTSTKLTCTDPGTFRKVWVEVSGLDGTTATVTAKGTWRSSMARTSQTSTTVKLGKGGARVFCATGGFAGPFGIILQPFPSGPVVKITNMGPLELVRGETTIIRLTVKETTGSANVSALDLFAMLPAGASVDVSPQYNNLTKGGELTVNVSIFVPANATKGPAGRFVATSNDAPAAVLYVNYVDKESGAGTTPSAIYWALILALFIAVVVLIALPAMRRKSGEGKGPQV